MLNWFFWDPPREAFYLPILHWPIVWYSILFATGFLLGYFIFFSLLKRYFLLAPDLQEKEILDKNILQKYFSNPKSLFFKKEELKNLSSSTVNKIIHREESFEKIQQKHQRESFWKEILEKAKMAPSKMVKACSVRFYLERILPRGIMSIQEKSRIILDHLAIYMVFGTVVGARLGHFLFYEEPSRYIRDPLTLFKVWEGGLASHGAIIGIICALLLFHFWSKKIAPTLTFLTLLDLVCIPTALVGCFIRIGNFFNQEISGTVSSVRWAVIFGHPFDGSIPAPRHPVQLYEAFFYLGVFIFLWFISKKITLFLKKGLIIGIFFLLVFTFRFFIEYFKEEQSALLVGSSSLTMGQILSIPVIVLGGAFVVLAYLRSSSKEIDHSS